MVDFGKTKGFEWDKNNIDKSYKKHGITPNQTEEVFLDDNLRIERDIKHSQEEKRFIAIGKDFEEKILFVVFTIRKDKIRVISGRAANKRERSIYEEKTKKDSKI